ncbi:hypothetical protein ACIG87_02710 [Micromonospora sp. NPDC051925]|uniref:hypothetical protein n=1 Tax=Micromonospora sp. NPDC051925 TaxID=3364288 RepID=UPI0037CCA6A2
MPDVLPSLQFTEYHKFLVSVGGLSMGLATALPLFLLKSQKVLTVKTEDLVKLDPASRKALVLQEEQILWLLKAWPVISAVLLFLGLGLVLRGAAVWRNRQGILDDRESAEIKRINAEEHKLTQEAASYIRSHQMPIEQKVMSVEQKLHAGNDDRPPPSDAKLTTDHGDPEARKGIVASNTSGGWVDSLHIPSNTPPGVKSVIDFFVTEEQIFERLAMPYSKVEIAHGVRFGDEEADAIFTSFDELLPNLIVGVRSLKAFSAGAALFEAEVAFRGQDKVKDSAEGKVRRPFRSVIVFLLSNASVRDKVKEAVNTALLERAKQSKPPLTVIAVKPGEVSRLSIDPKWLRAGGSYLHWHE